MRDAQMGRIAFGPDSPGPMPSIPLRPTTADDAVARLTRERDAALAELEQMRSIPERIASYLAEEIDSPSTLRATLRLVRLAMKNDARRMGEGEAPAALHPQGARLIGIDPACGEDQTVVYRWPECHA